MATSYFSRTPASAGNRKTFTISFWQKRSKISYNYDMMIGTAYSAGAGNSFQIFFDNTDKLNVQAGDGSYVLATTQLFRDVSAWYHIVVAVDTTQATSSNRIKLYVNGSQVTSFSTATYMSQNLDTAWNNTIVQKVGDFGLNYLEGYLANVINVDGTALTPSSFGETDATTGIWKPKSYTGSYGTNGFFLKFENSGSLGTDSSGNGNNFTVNGTPTQTVDTPSNVFATLNPLANLAVSGSGTLAYGNTQASYTAGAFNTQSTIAPSAGKWYWETKSVANTRQGTIGTRIGFHITEQAYSLPTLETNTFGFYVHPTAGIYRITSGTNTLVSSSLTYVDGDIIGIALDLTNNISYWYKNGNLTYTYNFTSYAPIGAYTYTPAVGNGSGSASPVLQVNFGNGVFGTTAITSPVSDTAGLGKFQYAVPAGYYSLCTKNINSQG